VPARSLARALFLSLALSPSISRTASCRSVSRLERALEALGCSLSDSLCARGVSCARLRIRSYCLDDLRWAGLELDPGPAAARSLARSLARSHARTRSRARDEIRDAAATAVAAAAARQAGETGCGEIRTFLTRIRDAARHARDDPPCAYHGPPRRADQRAAVTHDGVSLPRWKNRTQHSLSSKLQNGGKAHAVARDAFWGPVMRRAAPPPPRRLASTDTGGRAHPRARHFRIRDAPRQFSFPPRQSISRYLAYLLFFFFKNSAKGNLLK